MRQNKTNYWYIYLCFTKNGFYYFHHLISICINYVCKHLVSWKLFINWKTLKTTTNETKTRLHTREYRSNSLSLTFLISNKMVYMCLVNICFVYEFPYNIINMGLNKERYQIISLLIKLRRTVLKLWLLSHQVL